MARPLRNTFPGACYHVTARGDERRVIYRDDTDRKRFVELFAEWSDRFSLCLHGYVLMPNHYHLIVETGASSLSTAMQWFNVSYTVWFNRRHRRVGHLFQGRFKAIIVEIEQWRVALSRYVHLNPVRVSALGLGKSQRAHAPRVPALAPSPKPSLSTSRLAARNPAAFRRGRRKRHARARALPLSPLDFSAHSPFRQSEGPSAHLCDNRGIRDRDHLSPIRRHTRSVARQDIPRELGWPWSSSLCDAPPFSQRHSCTYARTDPFGLV